MNPADPRHMTGFLPATREEMDRLGWDALDVLIVSGDAYVDHPSFGAALLGRWLAAHGYRAGIAAQPRWTTTEDVTRMGRPRLCVGVTAGALDSMLAHYTAFRKKRSDDAYTPGGAAGARPNRAVIVYAGLARQAFPGVPVVAGGIEASMRRATHYDFWEDGLRRSILLDSKADLLLYGMAERALLEVCGRLRQAAGAGAAADTRVVRRLLRGIRGSAWAEGRREATAAPADAMLLPSHEEILADPSKLIEATLMLERQVQHGEAHAAQRAGGETVVFAPPAEPLTPSEMDALYALPFSRRQHPSHRAPVPALETVRFSVTTHRGCGGGCSFCSLALHQGRRVASRTARGVMAEVAGFRGMEGWAGTLTDVGGPTANLWGASCAADPAACARSSCLAPGICARLRAPQGELAGLLRALAGLPGVRHVRVASGVRHDLAMRDPEYLRALVGSFVGGQLKVAPEHCSDAVLELMRKPPFRVFEQFLERFRELSREAGREQYVVPYLVSAFPGCTQRDMLDLRRWLDRRGWRPQQVQCFVPTPGTVATAMFLAGRDARGNPIHVARTDAERLRQHRALTAAWRTPASRPPSRRSRGRARSTGSRA